MTLQKAGILCLSYTYEDEFGSTKTAKRVLYNASEEMQTHKGAKDMYSAAYIVGVSTQFFMISFVKTNQLQFIGLIHSNNHMLGY
jgi:hypothetical protein